MYITHTEDLHLIDMSFLECLPHEIYHKIYHSIYDGCVDELMGLFRHVQEHVPVYDDHGDMYKHPMTPYSVDAISYDPFERSVTFGKGVFMTLRSPKDISHKLVDEYAKICTRYTPNQVTPSGGIKRNRQSVYIRPCLEADDIFHI